MTAYQLHYLDLLRLQCEGAFANRASKALNKTGKKYLFKTIDDYIDFEKSERNILGDDPTHKNVDKNIVKQVSQINQANQKGG